MNPCVLQLTVWFENPSWVGIFEREIDEHYSVCKVTFGAEPEDEEVHAFVLDHYHTLTFFTSDRENKLVQKSVNPKRLQRMVQRQAEQNGIGTKAQEALKEAYSQKKLEKKKKHAIMQEQLKEQKFLLRQEKRKQKHRGH